MTTTVYTSRIQQGDDLAAVLEELTVRSGCLPELKAGARVLLKPNYVAPFPKATTDFAFLDFFIQVLRKAGVNPVVGEMSGYEFDTESTLRILGVRSFLEERNVPFINFEHSSYSKLDIGPGLPTVEVADIAFKVDYIINLPVLKGHTITKMTGATKNFFGLLSRESRRKLHCRGLNKGIAALARSFPNVLHIVDARFLLTRAVFGEVKPLGYCLMGTDSLALDHLGCHLLGINPESVKHLESASRYLVDGPVPEERILSDKATVKERFHRLLYSCFYYLDECKCRLFGGTSLIPHLHWVLGVHPDVKNVPADRLDEVAHICPIDAISVKQRKVLKEKCLTVRCLRCYTQDPTGKVILKGFNAPRKMG